MMPTVIEMLEAQLKAQDYDGLFNVDGDCACAIGCLNSCDEPMASCEAGYRVECPKDCGEHEFHIHREKPCIIGHGVPGTERADANGD